MIKEKLENPSRRSFGKAIAGLGAAATLSPLVAMESKAQAEQRGQEIRKKGELRVINSPIKIDSSLKRFAQTDTVFYDPEVFLAQTKSGEMAPWYIVRDETTFNAILESKYTKDISAPSVAAARSVFALSNAGWNVSFAIGEMENRAGMTWNAPYETPIMMRPPDEKDPTRLTTQTKFASRKLGSDIVGIAPLNENWIYTNAMVYKDGVIEASGPDDVTIKSIVFKDVEKPTETQTQLIIPKSVNNVIVSAFAMNREMHQTAPTQMAEATVGLGYSRMAIHDTSLCQFIRSMGYIAIPCGNGVGQSVPMAIEAGIGEASRMGTVITPEYGPNVRLSKILTNMPLTHGKPIEFGVEKFCETCKKCARDCPSKTITEGKKSFKARNKHNQGGKLQWQNEYRKCHNYWMESGGSCGICVAVCPFTKGDIWIHDGVEWAIKNASFLDPFMLGMDDALGYGEWRDPEEVWNGNINTYGLDADHFQDTKKSYGGKKS